MPDLLQSLHTYFAGAPVSFANVLLDGEWATPFQEALAQALRGVPWGEVVTYGELSALAGRERAARAAGTFCAENRFSLFVPCHRVVSANGIGGYGSLGVEYKRGSSRSRACGSMALSDELRSELAAIAPDAGLLPPGGDLRAVPLCGQRAPPRPRPGRAPPRRLDVGDRPAGVHAPARGRDPLGDPHLQPPRLRPGNPVPAPRERRRARDRDARRGRRPRHATRAGRTAAEADRRALCCRGAYLRGALLGGGSLSGPRAPHLELRTASLEGAEFLRRWAAGAGARLGVVDRGRHAAAYAKGFDAIGAPRSSARASASRCQSDEAVAALQIHGATEGEPVLRMRRTGPRCRGAPRSSGRLRPVPRLTARAAAWSPRTPLCAGLSWEEAGPEPRARPRCARWASSAGSRRTDSRRSQPKRTIATE